MKIFGIEFNKKPSPTITNEKEVFSVIEAAPESSSDIKALSVPNNKKPANIERVKSNVLNYTTFKNARGQLNESEYDIEIINRIIDTDSYVHQAFIKKTGLMFKEGFQFVGPNPKTIRYVKTRFAQIARASGIPTEELIRNVGSSLITKSNTFLVKARKASASGGKVRKEPGLSRELDPVAAYFIIPAETMKFEADKFGRVVRWKQEMPDGSYSYYRPEDVVHLYFNRKDGYVYGTPTIVPVVEDIRSLRKIEENIELLVYNHLFPLFHYTVGSDNFPATLDEEGNDEIELARREIQMMPSEGGIVTSHRHKISLIGAENRSLRAEGYLEHFKKRVFSGLGISAVDMGEGECYSADTETLTESGWKLHWQIDHVKERIGTFNPDTKQIEFHLANYKHESKYHGLMYGFKKREALDILVTPKHDMLITSRRQDETRKVPAEMLALVAGEEEHSLFGSALFTEDYVEDFISSDIAESWMLLVGLLTFGKLSADKKNIEVTCKPNYVDKTINALTELQVPYKLKRKLKATSSFSFSANVFDGYFLKYLSTGTSFIQELLKFPYELRRQAAEVAVDNSYDYLIQTYNRNTRPCKGYVVFKKSEKIIDNLQLLSEMAGYVTSIETKNLKMCKNKDTKFLRVVKDFRKNHTYTISPENIEVRNYSGTVFCYNVPNHAFVTRRNGLIAINGNTANRATSDNMSRNLVDSVKDVQRVIESQFSEFIINELLLESTFGNDVLNEENKVYLKFKEIDLAYQIKKEAHYADQFNKNVISQHEARIGMGRQPMEFPTLEETNSEEDLAKKYPDWFATQWKLISEPTSLIVASDEPYSAAAQAMAASRSTQANEKMLAQAQAKSDENSKVKQLARPASREVPQDSQESEPVEEMKDSVLLSKYNDFETDVVRLVSSRTYSQDWAKQIGFIVKEDMTRVLKAKAMTAFSAGYRSILANPTQQISANIRSRPKIESRVNFYVDRLITKTLSILNKQNLDTLEINDKIQKVKSVFDSIRFRNSLIEGVEVSKAYNLGVIEAGRDRKAKGWTLDITDKSCEMCKNSTDLHDFQNPIDIDMIPPLHPNSKTKIKLTW